MKVKASQRLHARSSLIGHHHSKSKHIRIAGSYPSEEARWYQTRDMNVSFKALMTSLADVQIRLYHGTSKRLCHDDDHQDERIVPSPVYLVQHRSEVHYPQYVSQEVAHSS